MPFDPGIIILGLGCLALLAGLGAWIWEYIKTPKAAESARNGLEISAPAPSTKTSANTPGPAIQTAPPESSHPPQPVSPTATALPPLLPQPVPTPVPPLPPSAIQQVELKQENVDADATYETTLAEVQPADPPEPPPIAPPPVLGAGDENEKNILSCTGTVLWRSPDEDNGKTIGTIERAIFRDSFQTLKLELRYPNRDWPAELTMRRDTTSSYTGQAGTQSTDVHCQLVFNTLSGTKIGFKGLWYAYRTDTQACETFHVTGEIQPGTKARVVYAASVDPMRVHASLRPAKPQAVESAKIIDIPTRRFSLALGNFRGNPFLEILENNLPWGESHPGAQRHFSFGKRKARMVLAARKQIRSFVEDAGKDPSRHNGEVDADPWLDGSVTICGHEFFQINQRQIRRPYLQLKFGMESFSFGLSKAEALAYLMTEIENWAMRN